NGTFVDDFTAVGVPNSIGLAWDDAGNLYVSSYNGKYVRKFSSTGADLGNFVSTNLAGPTNIWFSENGELFVVDYNGGAVKRFDSQGNYLGIFISGLPQGEGVDFFPNGNIIIGSGGLHSVRIYDASGAFLNNLAPPGELGLQTPNAVVLRPVSPSGTREVYKAFTFVTPSVGVQFQIANTNVLQDVSLLAIHDSTGTLISYINFSNTTSWDASNLPNGIYYLTAKLKDGAIARQSVVIQH
ncbi:MAG: T9SS type A sorting domain-containing protein, partial [Saprospiraceae bacterium]|nr:T9SS type A sorting domain-containing protein [Saprospiraceae bacterium]